MLLKEINSLYIFFLLKAPLMVGAAGTAYLINDATTILPRAIITKARAYLAGAAADVLEVEICIFTISFNLLRLYFFYHRYFHLLISFK